MTYDQTTVEFRDRLYEAAPYPETSMVQRGAWQAGVYARLQDRPYCWSPYRSPIKEILNECWRAGWQYADQQISSLVHERNGNELWNRPK